MLHRYIVHICRVIIEIKECVFKTVFLLHSNKGMYI